MSNKELNRYSIEDLGECEVIYLNDEQMVSFDSKEEFISKFREVYNLTEKGKMEQHITGESKNITEYFSNKSDSEINRLLLLNLETVEGLELDESIEAEVDFTEDEYDDLFWTCTHLVWLLLDYQRHIVLVNNGEKDLVDELTKQFSYDCDSMYTEYDLSDTLVNKFLNTEEAEIYNKHVSEHERTKDEQYWLKAQYYVYLAGLRLARKVASGGIQCTFTTFVTDDYIY